MVIDNNILLNAGDDYFSEEVVIPDGVERIATTAFYSCKNLKKVTIPGSVKTIGTAAFSECHSLTTVCLSEGIEEILCGAFELCTKLENINIPSTIRYIADYAFKGCTSLTKIDLSNMIILYNDATINDAKVYEDILLADMQLDKQLSSLSSNTNSSVDNTAIPDDVDIICMAKPNKCIRKTPRLHKSLGKGIFEDCYYLKEVKLFPHLSYIPTKGFKNCWNLKTIELPDSIRFIDKSAFANCSSLNKIEIPDNVNYIGKKAFYCCHSLDKIEIPESVRTLHKGTFSGCIFLKTIIVGNKIKKISKNALPKGATIEIRKTKKSEDSNNLKLKKNSLYGERVVDDNKESNLKLKKRLSRELRRKNSLYGERVVDDNKESMD